jgi:citronellol/citronellal dehydrogenase
VTEPSSSNAGQPDLFGLTGKAVLITGASSLISVWTARLLLQIGAKVGMTDRLGEEGIRQAIASVAAQAADPELDVSGRVHLFGSVDIRNRKTSNVPEAKAGELQSVEQMVSSARAELGTIDVLINIAGGQEPVPAAALTSDLFRRTVDRILVGTWNVIHEVFEQCMRDSGGRILTVTADVDQGYPGMPAMGAARNGLSSLHRALSVEWAPLGITCCVIAPGATDTPGLRRYPQADRVRAMGIEAANLKRLLHPREIAWLFVTMASPWAAAVNGHTLVANGGDSNVTPVFRQMQKIWAG